MRDTKRNTLVITTIVKLSNINVWLILYRLQLFRKEKLEILHHANGFLRLDLPLLTVTIMKKSLVLPVHYFVVSVSIKENFIGLIVGFMIDIITHNVFVGIPYRLDSFFVFLVGFFGSYGGY